MNEIRLTYEDWYGDVYLDGALLDPGPSQRIWNHSPDGFSWGYGGSGPAQLALAILYAVTGDRVLSVQLHQRFKDDHVATWPQANHVARVDVAGWVAEHAPTPFEAAA